MKRILVPAALLIATLTLAGCGGTAPSASSGAYSVDNGGGAAPVAKAPIGTDSGGSSSVAQVDRSIVTTGTMTVTVTTPSTSADKAATIVEAVGGRVDARNENAPSQKDNGSASLTLRIPAAQLSATLEKLKALGKVEQIAISASDVTSQVQDTDARVKALQASVDRLTALLATASSTDVLVQIESSLTDREASLESMQAQQRSLTDQTSMSTITLSLISVADAPQDKPSNFLTGLQTGWNSFVGFMAGLLVVLGVLLPWIVFLGVIAAIVIFFVRRNAKKAQPAQPSMPAQPTTSAKKSS